ncbi:MAG: glycosyltransferase, partial [Oscillospiraceae bacterium]|nr:glycosyltransferase [Oscillospiraceae bacterium]
VILLIFAIAVASAFLGVLCAVCFVGGLQLFCTGVLGQYLAKTYMEVKKRPKYIIAEDEEIYQKRKDR